MDKAGTYKSAMTLEEFREIVRELQSQKPVFIEPYMSPGIRAQIEEAFREHFLGE